MGLCRALVRGYGVWTCWEQSELAETLEQKNNMTPVLLFVFQRTF